MASSDDIDGADAAQDRAVDEIVRRGPSGAFAVAGVATAIVVALLLAGALVFVLKLRTKLTDIRSVFEDGPA